MNISPVEAISRIGESVTIKMVVKRTKCCSGSHRVFLDSETNYRDPNNFGVVITEAGLAGFKQAGIDDPTAHFNGKTIRVQGVVVRKEDRPCMEVEDPEQIDVVR